VTKLGKIVAYYIYVEIECRLIRRMDGTLPSTIRRIILSRN